MKYNKSEHATNVDVHWLTLTRAEFIAALSKASGHDIPANARIEIDEVDDGGDGSVDVGREEQDRDAGSGEHPAVAEAIELEDEVMKALTPNQFEHFLRLVSALSPENLHCDGEISQAAARRKERALLAQWKALEGEVGRKVDESEVWAMLAEQRKERR
jgi:hypothetical protein